MRMCASVLGWQALSCVSCVFLSVHVSLLLFCVCVCVCLSMCMCVYVFYVSVSFCVRVSVCVSVWCENICVNFVLLTHACVFFLLFSQVVGRAVCCPWWLSAVGGDRGALYCGGVGHPSHHFGSHGKGRVLCFDDHPFENLFAPVRW